MIPGDIFAAKFRIMEILGQGGSSCVYLAENIRLGSFWAIKELELSGTDDAGSSVEPDILKRLEHPALPRIYDVIEENDHLYFVIDYIDGVSLDRKQAECGSFPEEVVLDWAIQVCDVLAYLHSVHPHPVIYRDMKPSNIMLTKSGKIKLIDFGTAREFKTNADTDTVFIGTRGYAAPEQYGKGQSDVKTDIFSFGVTLHHLLTGKAPNEPPYEILPVRHYNPELSQTIEHVVSRCTRQDPAQRYPSVSILREELQRIAARTGNPGGAATGGLEAEQGAKYGTGRGLFRKLILTIWGNPEFGCELGYILAKRSDCSVLMIDLDLLAPKADLHLNLKKYPGLIMEEGILGESGLNIAIEAAGKNMLTSGILAEASVRLRENGNLQVMTGNYKLDNYEYFSDENLIRLIEKAYASYDITLLLAGSWIYDSYSVIALAKSDVNLVPVHADIDKIREYNNYITFLADKQKIPIEKNKFIAYEYLNEVQLSKPEIDKAVEGNYIGSISYSRKRALFRNRRPAYAQHMEKEIEGEYLKLLRWLKIVPVPGIGEKLTEWFGRTANSLKRNKGSERGPVSTEGGESINACSKIPS